MALIFTLNENKSFAVEFYNFLTILLQVPLIFPVITLVVSVYLVIAPLVQDPAIEYLIVAISILAGLILYIPFVHYKKRLKLIGKF